MRLPLSTLTAIGFLLASLGACKKDTPDPQTQATTASYVLDGQARTCQAYYSTTTNATGYDYLTIWLNTTPQPSSGPETLTLTLRRPVGQPGAPYAYVPSGSIMVNSHAFLPEPPPLYFDHSSPLPTFIGTSLFGTFSAELKASPSTGTAAHSITAGTYTNVKLYP